MSERLYYMCVSVCGGKKRASDRSWGVGVTSRREPPDTVLKADSGALGESHELLTTGPSLQPKGSLLICFLLHSGTPPTCQWLSGTETY